MAVLTATVYAVSSLRTVGLCHGLFAAYSLLETIFGVEEKDIAISYSGVNHFYWVNDFTVKGEPGYPLLAKKLKEVYKDEAGMSYHKHEFCEMLYREFGYLTYPGDRHTCEFMPGYLNRTEEDLKRFGLVRTFIKERVKNRETCRKNVLKLASGELPPYEKSRETAVDIMKSFISGKPFIDVVNMPNIGQVENLPRGAVVETMGLVDARGFTPLANGKMSEKIQPLVDIHCKVQMMTLDAALRGDKEAAVSALRLDPMCSHLSYDDVRKMGYELMKATKKWLPQFDL
jgi:alpha-galactosidase